MSDSDANSKKKKVPSFPAAYPPPHPHACLGLNGCKNLGRTGENDCAGQGYCSTTTDHTCHVQNDCRDQGGCGLYGNAEELSNPAQNECKGFGSCATPINAERFITAGPYRGKSVWHLARQRFEERWEKGEFKKKFPEAPDTLGPSPEEFPNGPTYAWVQAGNCMTACGASGMSGAGSCS